MERRIALPKGDYYELRTRVRDAEVAELEAKFLRQKAQIVYETVAKAHAFDPTLTYRWDDATCELITDLQIPESS